MSWGRKDNNKYNRAEETHYWQTLVEEQVYWDCPWQHDWDDDDWWGDYWWDGGIRSMEELAQYRLLTLLRSLSVKSAQKQVEDRCW